MADTPATIILDGNTYYFKRGSYQVDNLIPYSLKETNNKESSYSSSGIWKKKFKFTLLCENNGVSGGGKTIRNQVRTTANKHTPLAMTTPDSDTYNVVITGDVSEKFREDPPEDDGWEYEMEITVTEI